ncbi:YlbL family protein [Litorihabitans aurantiacus]|uniref:Lon proteolytic domain-containing protein n=1 Tax=Litorihabitans aurantiacus TaxID=1930061 RepID=A0AA37XF24_9MICO|nr:S16 family serine protease [Litorihabitans aurantiacus]GMA32117.1 hypothetical protein GCM10025875_21090 [Litorihabitans aurantiacus]
MSTPRQPPEPARPGSVRTFDPFPAPVRAWERVPAAAFVLGLVLALLLLLCVLVPAPYAVRMPGPTVDTLGEVDDVPLITIHDAETYPTDGELRLTTVSVAGGPGYPVSVGNVLRGWLNPAVSVVPREAVFPDGETREEADERSQAQMTSSQTSATVAALEALDYEVPADLLVAGVVEDGAAHGVVAEGDSVVAITVGGERTDVASFSALTDVLRATPPSTAVVLTVRRDDADVDLDLTTGDDGEGGSTLGVLLDPAYTFPVDVDIEISNIGGSSAGTMFALGIMDRLTPGDATGGRSIAGTGTMDLSGDVGPIGGIVQKMNGSVRDGAEYFLAPADNCGEVVGHVPDGLTVFRVATLEEAWTAVQAIGADDTAGLPSCS